MGEGASGPFKKLQTAALPSKKKPVKRVVRPSPKWAFVVHFFLFSQKCLTNRANGVRVNVLHPAPCLYGTRHTLYNHIINILYCTHVLLYTVNGSA